MSLSRATKIGVLVGQLGTPDAPTAKALRPYLGQFLSDTRVIDYHPLFWQPILRGIILALRPRRSARLYERIWMPEGSPLLLYSQQQVEGLQERLGADFRVILGMTYGEPSIRSAVRTLESEGIDRIIVLPMYPQYSSTTTASVYDASYTAAAGRRCPLFNERKRSIPTLRFIEPFYEDPAYIQAMAQHLRTTIAALPEPPDKFILSFHGIPLRYVETGDLYPQHCEHTAQLLAEAMGWTADEWMLTYQSKFGPEQWLTPATDQTLEHLHQQGIKRPLVFSPGFTTDCLETLDELGNEGCEQFAEGGGDPQRFHLAACLNADPQFLDGLANLVRLNAGGWTHQPMGEQPISAR